MKYRGDLTAGASKQLRKLDTGIRRRIEVALTQLQADPRPAGAKKIVGAENAWRVRIGDYRAIYEINDDIVTIVVFRVAHRREV